MADDAHAPGGTEKKTRKRGANPRKAVFSSYTYAVMKSIKKDASIASDAMLVVDGILVDFADRLIAKSFKMAKYDQKSTLKAKHVKGAVNNMLRGDLLTCALAEGEKAITKYESA